jgi:hypothetical protein
VCTIRTVKTLVVVERPKREITARRFSRCKFRCGEEISPGQRIGEVLGGWAHMKCIVYWIDTPEQASQDALGRSEPV